MIDLERLMDVNREFAISSNSFENVETVPTVELAVARLRKRLEIFSLLLPNP